MRVHFIFSLALGLGACGSNSQHIDPSSGGEAKDSSSIVVDAPVDFRFPVYLVPDNNFWSGCAGSATDSGEACRADRVSELEAGVDQWLAYFPLDNRPVILVVEKDDLPNNVSNLQIVDLFVDNNRCKNVDIPDCFTLWACYEHSPKDIIFMEHKYVTAQVIAHELGHAFGLPHMEWFNKGCSSPIMSTPVQSEVVTDLDVQALCWKHPEITCPIYKGSQYETMLDTISCDKFWEMKKETKNTCE